jgi:hypothetical protein
MTITVFNESFVGLSELKLQRISDGRVLHLPTPANFVVQENKQQKIQRTKSSQGRTVRANTFIAGEEPVLNIDYNFMQPELIALRMGNQFEQKTYPIQIARTIEVTKEGYAGAEEGYLGYGMPADQPEAKASYRQMGKNSIPLTRVAYNSFDPSATLTFAQGANGALKFSSDISQNNETVSLVLPLEVTGIALGDELVGAHRVVAHLVNTSNYVWVFTAYNVTPNVEGSALDPNAEAIQLPFFINNPPGECRGWNLTFTNQKVKCAY